MTSRNLQVPFAPLGPSSWRGVFRLPVSLLLPRRNGLLPRLFRTEELGMNVTTMWAVLLVSVSLLIFAAAVIGMR